MLYYHDKFDSSYQAERSNYHDESDSSFQAKRLQIQRKIQSESNRTPCHSASLVQSRQLNWIERRTLRRSSDRAARLERKVAVTLNRATTTIKYFAENSRCAESREICLCPHSDGCSVRFARASFRLRQLWNIEREEKQQLRPELIRFRVSRLSFRKTEMLRKKPGRLVARFDEPLHGKNVENENELGWSATVCGYSRACNEYDEKYSFDYLFPQR